MQRKDWSVGGGGGGALGRVGQDPVEVFRGPVTFD